MTIKRAPSGKRGKLSSGAFNQFADAAEFLEQVHRSGSGAVKLRETGKQFILVQNTLSSGSVPGSADLDQFSVVGLGDPVITPDDDLDEFKGRIVLEAVTPTEADHKGKFALLLEPLAEGAIGRACVCGACVVQVELTDEDHEFADVTDSDATKLTSCDDGSALILWIEDAGTSVAVGTKWAVVLLQGKSPDVVVPEAGHWYWFARTFDASEADTETEYNLVTGSRDVSQTSLGTALGMREWFPEFSAGLCVTQVRAQICNAAVAGSLDISFMTATQANLRANTPVEVDSPAVLTLDATHYTNAADDINVPIPTGGGLACKVTSNDPFSVSTGAWTVLVGAFVEPATAEAYVVTGNGLQGANSPNGTYAWDGTLANGKKCFKFIGTRTWYLVFDATQWSIWETNSPPGTYGWWNTGATGDSPVGSTTNNYSTTGTCTVALA